MARMKALRMALALSGVFASVGFSHGCAHVGIGGHTQLDAPAFARPLG